MPECSVKNCLYLSPFLIDFRSQNTALSPLKDLNLVWKDHTYFTRGHSQRVITHHMHGHMLKRSAVKMLIDKLHVSMVCG